MKKNTLFLAVIFYLAYSFAGCKLGEKPLFEKITETKSKIVFNNLIIENDSLNILDYEFLYNGGGVAVADFDNDGLEDVFFTGSSVGNALYKNKGNFEFEDISGQAGIVASEYWCTGVTIVDINQDGKKDIYVSTSKHSSPDLRKNLLFINTTQNGKISFEEKATEYGVADTSHTMNAIFFDYDNDADLDLFVMNNKIFDRNDVTIYKKERIAKFTGRVDKLYRNDYDSAKGHAYFTDVSEEAGIIYDGFSLAVNICDINNDGWKDIYVSNDFISNDLLYINNQNGTFSNKINDYLNHTCFSAMGNDIADINNDGLRDIIALDMLPETNFRKKTMLAPNNYNNYLNNLSFGYSHQYVRNVLQLNRGNCPEKNHPIFSEIGMVAGIEATDWSWAPLVADFDKDGLRDLIITNGFPKDITDRDFMDYKANNEMFLSKKDVLAQIPEVKLTNYAYKNNGNLRFSNVSKEWGITVPSFSTGAAYADLDNDGDLDYITNNINDFAHVYKNNSNNNKNNYLKINLNGEQPNIDAIGTIINYKTKTFESTYEHSPARGYLSVMSETVFIGLGSDLAVSLEIIWPDGKKTFIKDAAANQTLEINKNSAKEADTLLTNDDLNQIFYQNGIVADTCFEVDFNDFNVDPLLIKKLSNIGQGIAAGDINNDGNEDFYIAGSRGFSGRLFISNQNQYTIQKLPIDINKKENHPVFFDIDMDGDLDLYIGCGSIEYSINDTLLSDILFINDNGTFKDYSHLLPKDYTITKTVKVADYNNDGDLDIFVGKGHKFNSYPLSETSYLLINESKKDVVKLRKDSNFFNNINMLVSDALWTDTDNDTDLDLMVVGDYTGIFIFENKDGKLILDKNNKLNEHKGFWNSIHGADLDGDGDIDYILGNIGLNNLIKASPNRPFRVYSKDFDDNGSYDFIPTTHYLDVKNKLKEVTYHVKGDVIKELNSFRKLYLFNKDYALKPITSVLHSEMLKNALINEVNITTSIILINEGNKSFKLKELPIEAQFAPIYGIAVEDINQDNKIDIIFQGNNYGIETGTGRMDASYGGILINNGNFEFKSLKPVESGFCMRGEHRVLTPFAFNGSISYISSQIDGPTSFFSKKNIERPLLFIPTDVQKIVFKDSKENIISVRENYITVGYLTQGSRYVAWPKNATKAVYKYANKNDSVISFDNFNKKEVN